jgi:cytochrome P450
MLPKGPSFKWLQTWLFLFRHRSYSAWLRRRYDDIVTLRLLLSSAPVVMVLTPEGARQVLTADADGYDAIFKEGFTALVGPGSIWVLEGLRHRRERQLLLPAFHARQIPSYRQAIKEVTLLHINEWRVGQDMRAYDAMLDISRDVILCSCFFRSSGHGGSHRGCASSGLKTSFRSSYSGARSAAVSEASGRPFWSCSFRPDLMMERL